MSCLTCSFATSIPTSFTAIMRRSVVGPLPCSRSIDSGLPGNPRPDRNPGRPCCSRQGGDATRCEHRYGLHQTLRMDTEAAPAAVHVASERRRRRSQLRARAL